jgi:hypothetical protein
VLIYVLALPIGLISIFGWPVIIAIGAYFGAGGMILWRESWTPCPHQISGGKTRNRCERCVREQNEIDEKRRRRRELQERQQRIDAAAASLRDGERLRLAKSLSASIEELRGLSWQQFEDESVLSTVLILQPNLCSSGRKPRFGPRTGQDDNRDSNPPSTGSSLQARYASEAMSMSGQDNWEFAGPDDAKAEIRAAVAYLLRDATGGARGDIVQEIIAIVRQIASGLPPVTASPLDDDMPGG